MNPLEWLNRNVPGFAELQLVERDAIANFSLLWSLFEARCLNENASSDAIQRLVTQWAADGRLDDAVFGEPLAYFRDRYFDNGEPTHHFDFLYLRRPDKPDLVKAVLRGEDNDPVNCATVVLIVVYRLRNNLFHGMKWAYGIRDQRSNFEQASNANSHSYKSGCEGWSVCDR